MSAPLGVSVSCPLLRTLVNGFWTHPKSSIMSSTSSTNYIRKDPVLKQGHVWRFQVDLKLGETLFKPTGGSVEEKGSEERTWSVHQEDPIAEVRPKDSRQHLQARGRAQTRGEAAVQGLDCVLRATKCLRGPGSGGVFLESSRWGGETDRLE